MTSIYKHGLVFLFMLQAIVQVWAQGGHDVAATPPPGAKNVVCKGRPVPQLEDVTEKAGIHFQHISSPDKKYIVESMSGGVLLIDYDRRLARHLFHQCADRGDGEETRASARCPLP